ncbi:MAG: tRNA (N6-threonylcarbamoyladenosine(37)-N6)-methyltransferase TrmO [Thiohalomonadaceae bacterium]
MGNKATSYTFDVIGIIHSPFKEKFGIPRQSGLMSAAQAELELLPPYDIDKALHGLDGFSHLWLSFVFHAVPQGDWSPTVRPPRLGGNQRVGVFASRSPVRPNPIGLSLVELTGMKREHGSLRLQLRGIDLLDGTPVLDIKPYVPYVDCIPTARTGFARGAPEPRLKVGFSAEAEAVCAARPQLREFIVQMLQFDPRPAYRTDEEPGRVYGVHVFDFNVRWQVDGNTACVIEILPSRP